MEHETITNHNKGLSVQKHDRKGTKFLAVCGCFLLGSFMFGNSDLASTSVPQTNYYFGRNIAKVLRQTNSNRTFAFNAKSANRILAKSAGQKSSGSKKTGNRGLGSVRKGVGTGTIGKGIGGTDVSAKLQQRSDTGTIVPVHKYGPDYKTERLQYAWKTFGDKRFMYLLLAENGAMTATLKHPKQKGSIGVDHGLCGINDYYHPEILKDPEFYDWKHQMEICYKLYKGGTTFYGIKNIWKTSKLILWHPSSSL